MVVGAAEDAVRQGTLTAAKAKLDLLRLAGLERRPRHVDLEPRRLGADAGRGRSALRDLAAAAKLDGMTGLRRGLQLRQQDDAADRRATRRASPPTRRRSPAQVPDLEDFIIGNEPNLNRFWLPQFNPDGTRRRRARLPVAALPHVHGAEGGRPGRSASSAGRSRRAASTGPGTGRDTHSPTVFIQDLGTAYRASGLTGPVMDALAIHPYPENSSIPPTLAHPNTTPIGIADYTKLVGLLGKAFDGTGQPGSTLPILYAEFGIEAQIPSAKASLYTGTEPATIKPVPEATQGAYYKQAIALSFCQPNVVGILLFHAFDESALDRFQSGLYYADGTPKSSLADRAGRGPRRARRRDRAVPRPGADAAGEGRRTRGSASVGTGHAPRSPSRATSTATCTPASRGCRRTRPRSPSRVTALAGERTLVHFPAAPPRAGPVPLHRPPDRAGERRAAARGREQTPVVVR